MDFHFLFERADDDDDFLLLFSFPAENRLVESLYNKLCLVVVVVLNFFFSSLSIISVT